MTIEDEFSITMEHWNETGDTPENLFTLENIYKYASDDELETIVHSIIGRTWALMEGIFDTKKDGKDLNQVAEIYKPADQELHRIAKGLRTPQ